MSESRGPSVEGAKQRLPEADVIKAAGIVVIPLIHSLRPLWDPQVSGIERWLLFTTRFAVPGFLFVSGLLGAGAPVSASRVRSRLERLLVPYAVATLAVEAFFLAHGRPVTLESAAVDFLSGSALGPYYYVFVVFFLTLAWPLFELARPGVLVLLAIVSVASQVSVELGLVRLPISWIIRNPFLWCSCYLLGWGARAKHEALLEWIGKRRGAVEGSLSVVCIAALGFVAFQAPGPVTYLVAWFNIYVAIALLFVLSTRLTETPGPVRWLSDASYAIYLYHLLVIYALWDPDQGPPGAFGFPALFAGWALGLVVPAIGVAVLQRALGARARTLFGA